MRAVLERHAAHGVVGLEDEHAAGLGGFGSRGRGRRIGGLLLRCGLDGVFRRDSSLREMVSLPFFRPW